MTDIEKFKSWLEGSKPVIPVIAIDQPEHAVPMAQALAAGGIKLLEVTLRTAAGLDAIRTIKEQGIPGVVVGAGTVCSAEQFTQAVQAGAEFIVSPGLTEELISAWQNAENWQGVFLPGVATASEVMRAREVGLTFLKCFPAAAMGGIPLLKGWAGPFSDVVFCPTGGLNPGNYQDYLALNNVLCIGGSWLTDKKLMDSENWLEIERIAKEIL